MHHRPTLPVAGEIVRNRALGTSASYRVLGQAGRLVAVEVLGAPGLREGTVVRMTRAAVSRMALAPQLVSRTERHAPRAARRLAA